MIKMFIYSIIYLVARSMDVLIIGCEQRTQNLS